MSTNIETQSPSSPNGSKIASNMTPEQHALKLLDDAITEWICDYKCDDLPGVFISANTLEPIFALLRHQEFCGSVIVAFHDGIPIGMVGRDAKSTFEDVDGKSFRIKS